MNAGISPSRFAQFMGHVLAPIDDARPVPSAAETEPAAWCKRTMPLWREWEALSKTDQWAAYCMLRKVFERTGVH